MEVAVRRDDSEVQKEPDVLFRYRVLEMLFSAAIVVKLKSEGSRMRRLLLHIFHATFLLSAPDSRARKQSFRVDGSTIGLHALPNTLK